MTLGRKMSSLFSIALNCLYIVCCHLMLKWFFRFIYFFVSRLFYPYYEPFRFLMLPKFAACIFLFDLMSFIISSIILFNSLFSSYMLETLSFTKFRFFLIFDIVFSWFSLIMSVNDSNIFYFFSSLEPINLLMLKCSLLSASKI
jgi:hypothetical protein